jgi:hypothetical protein
MPGICLADISQTVAVANIRSSTVLLQRIFSRMAGKVAESIDLESRLESTRTEQRLCQSLPLVNSSWLQISCIPRSWVGSLARSPTNQVSVKRAFSTTTGFDCHHCVSFVFTVTTSTRNHIKNNKRNTISVTEAVLVLCEIEHSLCSAAPSTASLRRHALFCPARCSTLETSDFRSASICVSSKHFVLRSDLLGQASGQEIMFEDFQTCLFACASLKLRSRRSALSCAVNPEQSMRIA